MTKLCKRGKEAAKRKKYVQGKVKSGPSGSR